MRLERGLYVTLHGPDGIGKTTAGRNVVKTLNENGRAAIFFDDWRDDQAWKNPFSQEGLRSKINEQSRQFAVLQLAKVALDSVVITELTGSGVTVVKDRGIYDVRADLSYRGLEPSECAGPLIREPDMAVLLTADEAKRQERLVAKQDLKAEDFAPFTPGSRLYFMHQSLLRQVIAVSPERGLILDTTMLSAEQVAEMIYKVIA